MPTQMKYRQPAGWRDYQENLKRDSQKRRWLRRGICTMLLVLLISGAIFILKPSKTTFSPDISKVRNSIQSLFDQTLDLESLKAILAKHNPAAFCTAHVAFETDQGPVHITTTIDADLQKYLTKQLMLRTSAHIGIVVLDAFTGEVLAMVSHDRQDPKANTCLNSQFPAASIFKIVAAAAVMEKAHLRPSSPLTFKGGKHTLYKSQITKKSNRHTTTTTLQKAFAGSINPVFGKLGAFTLKQAALLEFANRFGFQQPIDFTLPMKPSAFIITDRPYQWAELASGFNKTTTLSPLQGALIAATAVNEGKWITPRLIEKVTNGKDKIRYQLRPLHTETLITEQTARHLKTVMHATIVEGTGRKAFRGWQSDPVLSKLKMGGKTGGYGTNPRYDWFVGYGMDPNKDHAISVSVLVGHQDLIGTRAGEYARMAIKYYFETQMQQSQ